MVDESVDYASESWKAELDSIDRTILFNTEMLVYNILLIVYAFEYRKADEFDQKIIYLFPTLKAIFLWVNLEFALRYIKTA